MTTIEYERIEVRLRDGTLVLGKDDPMNGHCAKTYTNRTQAANAAHRERGTVIQRGRPFYVMLTPPVEMSDSERVDIGRRWTSAHLQSPCPQCGGALVAISGLVSSIRQVVCTVPSCAFYEVSEYEIGV